MSSDLLYKLEARKAELRADASALLDRAEASKRDLTTDERAKFDAINADLDTVGAHLDQLHLANARSAAATEAFARIQGQPVSASEAAAGEHRYGKWLAEYRANTIDTSTLTGKGRAPQVSDSQTSWFDLVRPQSKLLDAFAWQRIVTDKAQVDIPHIKTDGPATATNEGADITGNAGFDAESILVVPTKWSSYEAISSEVWNDAQPSLLDGFAKGIVKRHALAWEAALVAALEAGATTVATDANFATNLDVVSDAIVTMQAAGATPSGIVTTAAVAQALLKVKESAGSTKPILAGPADGFAGYVLGVPLVVSSAVTATKACVFDASQTVLVVRQTPLIEVSGDALFGTDSIAIRAVSRFAAKLMNATGAYVLTDTP